MRNSSMTPAGAANFRPVKKECFTAANHLRCYAVIIMAGLVEARDNPELFACRVNTV